MTLAAHFLAQGSGWAVVAAVVVMLLRGDIVPRRTLDDALRDRDAWRAAHSVSEDGRHEALRQSGELLDAVHTANHVLQAIPTPSGEVTRAPVDQASMPTQG